LKILNYIFCDDIRHEIGGKVTLVGVYNDRIVFNPPPNLKDVPWPVTLKLGVFVKLCFDSEDKDIDSFELELLLNNDKILQRINGKIAKKAERQFLNIVFVNPALQIPSAGEINTRITFKENNKKITEVSPEFPFKLIAEPNKIVH
jgi:hypothetical protein